MSGSTRLVKVWDAPTRLFHWVIAGLVGFSWFSMHESWMELHFLSGYTILALLLFRLVWGFVGSDTARFARFLRSPLAALWPISRSGSRRPIRRCATCAGSAAASRTARSATTPPAAGWCC
jgi:cytochrome b